MKNDGQIKFKSRQRIKSKNAQISLEFILVLPFLMFIMLFSIEMSLMWRDYHIIKYANFEAARVVSMSDASDPCESEMTLKKARKAAAIRIASIAPRADVLLFELMRGVGLKETPEINLPKVLGSRTVKAASRVVLGYPAAITLTSITCKREDNKVMVGVEYLRAPKTPFVRDAIWAMHVLSKLNSVTKSVEDHVPDWVDLPEIKVSDRDFRTIEISGVRIKTKDMITDLGGDSLSLIEEKKHQIGTQIKSMSDVLSSKTNLSFLKGGWGASGDSQNGLGSIPLLADDSMEGGLFGNVFSKLDVLMGDQVFDLEIADDFASVIQKMIYIIPTSLRLIPMKSETYVDQIKDISHKQKWEADFKGLTKFAADDPGDPWSQWAVGMQKNNQKFKEVDPDE